MKKLTTEDIMVKPINAAAIELLVRFKLSDQTNEAKYRVDEIAFVENLPVITNDECCYQILEKKMIDGIVGFCPEVSVYISNKTETGWIMPMNPAFSVVLTENQLDDYLLPPITLKEFMGSRHEYNPRISTNTREMINALSGAIEKSKASAQ